MMTALAFPKMFAANKTVIADANDATLLNAGLILHSKIKEFFGNPEFGSVLVELLFKNNAPVLLDVIIDTVYTTLLNYIPLIKISKEDIVVLQGINSIYVNVTIYNKKTQTNDLFTVNLSKNNSQVGDDV